MPVHDCSPSAWACCWPGAEPCPRQATVGHLCDKHNVALAFKLTIRRHDPAFDASMKAMIAIDLDEPAPATCGCGALISARSHTARCRSCAARSRRADAEVEQVQT
jgi:hypothetical protein